MVIEHEMKKEIPVVEGYQVIKSKKYGRTKLTYLRRVK